MQFVALDTETDRFAPGEQVPRLACVTAWRSTRSNNPSAPVTEPLLLGHGEGLEFFEAAMEEAIASPDEDPVILTLQNGPYDFAVMAREAAERARPQFLARVFDLYDAGRVWDTLQIEWLLDTADGMLSREPWNNERGWRKVPKGSNWYGLARLARKYAHMELDKLGAPRTTFGGLRGTPTAEWPEAHVLYALDDARAQLRVALGQLERALADQRKPLGDAPAQGRAYWALHLVSAWGLTTDLPAVLEYKAELEAELARMRVGLTQLKMSVPVSKTRTLKGVKYKDVEHKMLPLLEQQKDGHWKCNTKVLQALVAQAYQAEGKAVPMTEPSGKFPQGQVSTSSETIEDCADARLEPWKAHQHSNKMLDTYVPRLAEGIVHPRYGFAMSGRTTSYEPNIQNLPRKGKVRECYVPRAGYLLCSVDYGSQEMVTFAQVMQWVIGDNSLAEALNQNLDPHLLFACEQMLHITYDEGLRRKKAGDPEVLSKRQKAKGPNFGYPGGMGAEKFCEYMRSQDPPEFYTIEEAEEIRNLWFVQWRHDPRRYFRHVSKIVEEWGWCKQFVSGRVRGGVGFTDCANTYFQGLAADMSKAALYEVVRRCYTGRTAEGKPSALAGCRVVAFIHDELLAELLEHRAHEAAHEIAAVMRETSKRYCPDVKGKAEPALMRRWYKGAEYVEGPAGLLVPWEPKKELAA